VNTVMNLGFHKMLGSFWVAQLTASQEGLSSMNEWMNEWMNSCRSWSAFLKTDYGRRVFLRNVWSHLLYWENAGKQLKTR
jgi:hypothetical protein